MPPRVNYGFQKSERDRIKKAKKDAKIREREAAALAKSATKTTTTTDPDAGHETDPVMSDKGT